MSKYEQDKIFARRILMEQLAEIDNLTDDEISAAKTSGLTPSLAILTFPPA